MPGEDLLRKAQWLRMLGWILILLPLATGLISQIRHHDTLFMFIGTATFFELILGGIGWFMLWMASQCRERARQMGAIL